MGAIGKKIDAETPAPSFTAMESEKLIKTHFTSKGMEDSP